MPAPSIALNELLTGAPVQPTIEGREKEEVDVFAAFHLETYSAQTQTELFAHACRVLRENGIRVLAGASGPDVDDAIGAVLHED